MYLIHRLKKFGEQCLCGFGVSMEITVYLPSRKIQDFNYSALLVLVCMCASVCARLSDGAAGAVVS